MHFFFDDRFTMLVALERASITDYRPQGSIEDTIEVFSKFANYVIRTLDIKVLTRVGNRNIYTIACKSLDEARQKLKMAVPNALPKKPLFSLEPSFATPSFRLEGNDGELAYNARLYCRERKVGFSPPPDAAVMGLERTEKASSEIVFDVDFFTAKAIATESFEAKSWVQGWSKVFTRDADTFLSLAEGSR